MTKLSPKFETTVFFLGHSVYTQLHTTLCLCGCRKSACNGSDSELKDGDDMAADNVAMAADLHEVRASQCEFVFHASFYMSVVFIG